MRKIISWQLLALIAILIFIVFSFVFLIALMIVIGGIKRYEISDLSRATKAIVVPTPLPTPNEFDIRVDNVYSWSKKYNCPLSKNSTDLVAAAYRYGLDYRLLPAIAFRESTCGKQMAGNNPFGFGYYKFDSIPEATDYVAAAISGEGTKDAKYYKKAGKDPAKILGIYNTVVPTYTQEVLAIMEEIGE